MGVPRSSRFGCLSLEKGSWLIFARKKQQWWKACFVLNIWVVCRVEAEPEVGWWRNRAICLCVGEGISHTFLAYGWRAGNLNWPIRIQPAGKILVSCVKLTSQERHGNQASFPNGDGVIYPRKGIFNFKNHTSWQKVKTINHFVFLNFYFGTKNACDVNSLIVCRVSQGRIIIVLFWTKYAVPRHSITTWISSLFVCFPKSMGHKWIKSKLEC